MFCVCLLADNYSEEEYESFSSEQEASDDAVQGQVRLNSRNVLFSHTHLIDLFINISGLVHSQLGTFCIFEMRCQNSKYLFC